jgi:hypothetical protein
MTDDPVTIDDYLVRRVPYGEYCQAALANLSACELRYVGYAMPLES